MMSSNKVGTRCCAVPARKFCCSAPGWEDQEGRNAKELNRAIERDDVMASEDRELGGKTFASFDKKVRLRARGYNAELL